MKKTITKVIGITASMFLAFGCSKEQLSPQNAAQSNDLSTPSVSSKLNAQDTEYLVTTAEGSKSEVLLGNLALTHAKNSHLRDFGIRMIDDHSRQYKEVKKVADSEGVSVPDHPSKEQLEEFHELSKDYGAKFDKEYISYEVWDHHGDIADADKELNKGNAPDVVRLAKRWLPILQDHLDFATSVAKIVGAKKYHP